MIEQWIDKNGLIKPRLSWTDSGNGIFYSSFLMCLYRAIGEECPKSAELDQRIRACFKNPGLLMRTPDNKYGNESHDDYLGFAVHRLSRAHPFGLAINVNDWFCKMIIERGWWTLFIYKNDPDNSLKTWFKAWLGRFVDTMLMVHVTAYGLDHMTKKILSLYLEHMPIDENDSSGVNLSWMFAYGCDLLGIESDKLRELTLLLPKSTRAQFDEGHPIIEYADKSAQVFIPGPALRATTGGE